MPLSIYPLPHEDCTDEHSESVNDNCSDNSQTDDFVWNKSQL